MNSSSSITRAGWVATVVCLLMQVLIAPHIALFGATPLFLIIPLVIVATSADMTMGVVFAFLLGFLFDLGSGEPLGTMSLAFTLCVVICQLLGPDPSGTPSYTAAAASVVVVVLLQGILLSMMGFAGSLGSILITRVLVGIVYTGIVTLVGLGIAQMGSGGSKAGRSISSRLH